MFLFLALFLALHPFSGEALKQPSFVVGKNCFLRDGKPFQYISGTIHYWRQPPEYWNDTFQKMKAAGLNALSTYINWNLHEPEPLEYTFEGQLDIRKYFQLAQQNGLVVILRPGPFIDAEVDMGGLPYWLLRMNSTMRLRTSDPSYLMYVERWYRKVMPLLSNLTYANGGPIVTVQIENEYGSYPACDRVYQNKLKNLTLELMGPNIVLYTTDGPAKYMIECGRVNDTLTTVDFGAGDDATPYFALLRQYNVDGPLVNSEFYPGWIDHWSYGWNTVDTADVIKTAEQMILMNASFNFYPIRGGSNFGFVVGSNMGDDFQPVTTSYDFDAPLTEAGDITDKYLQVRKMLGKYVPIGPVPPSSPKGAYGKVKMSFMGSVFQNLKYLRPQGPVQSDYPLSFEILMQAYGFVLYRTVVDGQVRDPSLLSIPVVRDRAIVYVDQSGQTLDILVHNEGRLCYGTGINDMKGILSNVTLGKANLTDWDMYPLELPGFPVVDPIPLDFPKRRRDHDDQSGIAGFYSGSFKTDKPLDTFLKLDGWTTGYAFINGHNLGRYWPVQGPQITLYVPGAYLSSDSKNIIEVFELENAPCSMGHTCKIEFIDHPILNGTVPNQAKKIYKVKKEAKRRPWKMAAIKVNL